MRDVLQQPELDLPAYLHLESGTPLWKLWSSDTPAVGPLLICKREPKKHTYTSTHIAKVCNEHVLKPFVEVQNERREIRGKLWFWSHCCPRDWFNELKWTEESTSISCEDRPGNGHSNEYLVLLLYQDFISWFHQTKATHIHQNSFFVAHTVSSPPQLWNDGRRLFNRWQEQDQML